jgi:hypothetical protein
MSTSRKIGLGGRTVAVGAASSINVPKASHPGHFPNQRPAE